MPHVRKVACGHVRFCMFFHFLFVALTESLQPEIQYRLNLQLCAGDMLCIGDAVQVRHFEGRGEVRFSPKIWAASEIVTRLRSVCDVILWHGNGDQA